MIWNPLSEKEGNDMFAKFEKEFYFQPGEDKKLFRIIKTGLPAIKFDVSSCLGQFYEDDIENSIKALILENFTSIVNKNEMLYALDWQHECFKFDPRKINLEKNKEWPIAVLPDGDYIIFISKDFKNVWFGHPWERSITLIGQYFVENKQTIIPAFEKLVFRKLNE